MFIKTITYKDYNGTERTETHLFDINEAEALDMEVGTEGGYSEMLKKLANEKRFPELVKIFREFILKAYGVKSPDGRRFIKSEELSTEFSQTGAFVKLYTELATDSKAAAEFVNGVLSVDPNLVKPESKSE